MKLYHTHCRKDYSSGEQQVSPDRGKKEQNSPVMQEVSSFPNAKHLFSGNKKKMMQSHLVSY